jgi:hypothetical protein
MFCDTNPLLMEMENCAIPRAGEPDFSPMVMGIRNWRSWLLVMLVGFG